MRPVTVGIPNLPSQPAPPRARLASLASTLPGRSGPETESGIEMRACARCERPVQMGGASGQTRTSGRVGKRAGCFAVEFLLHHLYRRYARGS